ncbi:cobyrinate a,c-diamide synthase [Brunnivagina elsteri]|uniref:Cobyrinate a,c-diamide synthase n=1 Tax=Brunnivagina elsteri CCALA 953 TaxID=987040 RepID=A0A2A2TNL1_9CYAN|nr:cobyrinate a,c-diamide synthase [Calothrix elsteri]PAX60126.1 cobyrinic acid a,c-diamide synthase [Calothrix elsteri CCALA 953]
MAIIIAGERSGVGKTTVTLALLSALRNRNQKVQSFKVGPDYIDPMFHGYITNLPCRNLDPFLTSESYVQQCFIRHSKNAEYAVIEGVMGLFDGAAGGNDYASTAHIARLLDLPVVLVLDCSRLSRSVAAIAHGYKTFDPRIKIAGFVLNRVGSDRHLELLTDALKPLHLPILGVLRRQDNITIPDRHLGLIPSNELENLNTVVEQLAQLGESCFDWGKLLPLMVSKVDGEVEEDSNLASKIRIAIARDSAFNFYYPDNLDILRSLGADLVNWSPLKDTKLPEDVQGLYFGGGFPEVFAAELADNYQGRKAVENAIFRGIPTYGECGGLMYLCERIIDFSGNIHPMVGIIPSTAVMGKRLTLGYRNAIAMQDSPMISRGSKIRGHEFHRSTLNLEPQNPLFTMQLGYDSQNFKSEGWQIHQVHASYLHVHFGGNLEIPSRFLKHCFRFADSCETVLI